jgi:hypothetical protein
MTKAPTKYVYVVKIVTIFTTYTYFVGGMGSELIIKCMI